MSPPNFSLFFPDFLLKVEKKFYLSTFLHVLSYYLNLSFLLDGTYCNLKLSIHFSFSSSSHHKKKKLTDPITINNGLICLTKHHAKKICLYIHTYLNSAPFSIVQLAHFYSETFIPGKEHSWSIDMTLTQS